MTKRRILVIDDEPHFVQMLKLVLERTGTYEVHTETRGRQGVAAARGFQPDLILLDVIMPDLDGGEVASQMRDDERLQQIPIVFVTATASRNEVKAAGSRIGGHLFLAKPVSIPDLVACIEAQLNGNGHGH